LIETDTELKTIHKTKLKSLIKEHGIWKQ
jgi:hypothetical protein